MPAKVYVPKLLRRIIPRNRKSRLVVESARPLYPGYIFIDPASAPISDIKSVPFVTHIFMRTLFVPATIPLSKINMLLRQDEGDFPFRLGERVRITGGPFVGRIGVIAENDRVELIMFGRPLVVSFLASELEKVY